MAGTRRERRARAQRPAQDAGTRATQSGSGAAGTRHRPGWTREGTTAQGMMNVALCKRPLAPSGGIPYSLLARMAEAERYIIQVERPGERIDMAAIRVLLGDTGVELDSDYGPVPVNPKLGRYVVRGLASPDARGHGARRRGAGVGFVNAGSHEMTQPGEVRFAGVEAPGALRRIPQAAVGDGHGGHGDHVGMRVRSVDALPWTGVARATPLVWTRDPAVAGREEHVRAGGDEAAGDLVEQIVGVGAVVLGRADRRVARPVEQPPTVVHHPASRQRVHPLDQIRERADRIRQERGPRPGV